MGWSFHRSIRCGPFRINLSRRGVGVSGGVKGLRVGTGPRGRYFRAGLGSLLYQKYFASPRAVAARRAATRAASNASKSLLWTFLTTGIFGVILKLLIALVILAALILALLIWITLRR